MKTVIAYTHRNRFGLWSISWTGRFWRIALDDEPFGDFKDLAGAHEDLVWGFCGTAPNGMDPEACGLPDDLADWNAHHR